jgi:putative transposase
MNVRYIATRSGFRYFSRKVLEFWPPSEKHLVGEVRNPSYRNKMQRDRQTRQRRSIRLQAWDYSWPWWYYVTIVVNDGRTIFGKVVNDEVRLSRFGQVVQEKWLAIPKRYKNVELDNYVVMPNHFHGIVIISDNPVEAIHESPLRRDINPSHEEYIKRRRRMTLSKIVGWFKMNSAKQINLEQQTSGRAVWQRGFYDHIIRNDADLHRIRTYMANNPLQWAIDEENPDHQS